METEVLELKTVPKSRINRKYLPVKFALFCWFAAGIGTSSFLPVFLKHQGLTVTHFSIFTGISVFMQFSASIVSAFVADKIGRIKPFLFFFLALFWMACLGLPLLPSVGKCNLENASFVCYNEETFHLAATSCQIAQNNTSAFSCSKISVENKTNLVDQNETSKFLVALHPKFDVNFKTENINNISVLESFTFNYTNCSVKNIFPCISNDCTLPQTDYVELFMECNENETFWIIIYGILVVLLNLAQTNVFRFSDVIVSDLACEYGKQRVFGVLGVLVGPPLIGVILDKTNESNDMEKNYMMTFVCGVIFSVFTAISMGMVNPKFHKPASKMWNKSFGLVKNLNIMMFLALLITMGTVAGFKTIYQNWYLKELGASDLLIGIVSGASAFYGIPSLCISEWCIKKVGARNIFILGLLGNAVSSFSYAAIEEPSIALIIESTSILTYHLFWVATIQYSGKIAPDGLEAVMKTLAGTLHFNIGRLGSSLIGGYVMNTYGGKAAFSLLGCIAFAHAFVYGSYLIVQRLKQKKVRSALNSPSTKEV